MVHVAATISLRPGPFAFPGTDVDQVDQGCPGSKLQHSMFGQGTLDGATKHALIEKPGLGHVADQQYDVIETFELEWRVHGALFTLMAPNEKGRDRRRTRPCLSIATR
jgi:hypothetical protein